MRNSPFLFGGTQGHQCNYQRLAGDWNILRASSSFMPHFCRKTFLKFSLKFLDEGSTERNGPTGNYIISALKKIKKILSHKKDIMPDIKANHFLFNFLMQSDTLQSEMRRASSQGKHGAQPWLSKILDLCRVVGKSLRVLQNYTLCGRFNCNSVIITYY